MMQLFSSNSKSLVTFSFVTITIYLRVLFFQSFNKSVLIS